jgi:hypothetical protein
MKYFSYEELHDLRKKVINEHSRNLNEEKCICDEKEDISEIYESGRTLRIDRLSPFEGST